MTTYPESADLTTEGVITFDNPKTGQYVVPLKNGNKMRLEINASKAIGSYRIEKKTIIK